MMGSAHLPRLPPRLRRPLQWLTALLMVPPLLAVLFIAIFGWNWARGPLQNITFEKTGRALVIGGDLHVKLGWPAVRVRAEAVTFANPAWAKEKQMLTVDDVDFSLDLLSLLQKQLVFPEVRLKQPVVALELAADGRKTWLLDADQSDDNARIPIGRLTLDQGQLKYDDAKQKTSIRANLSTAGTGPGIPSTPLATTTPGTSTLAGTDTVGGVVFDASGTYKGLKLAAKGSGGSVLALRDEAEPYPLAVDGSIGSTHIKARGSITSLLKFRAMDMQLALRGNSMAELFPVLGVALPETHPYATTGHITHSAKLWRYDKFTGRMGNSDIAGSLQVDLGRARAFMQGELVSQVLDFADLGPMIGAKETALTKASAKPATRVLPDIPFKTERWDAMDADVTLHAKTLLRAKELPLENLVIHVKLDNKQMTLDPLDFGIAGGHIKAVIALDGRQNPIQTRAKVAVRKLLLPKLFPTVELTKTSIGEVNGNVDVTGRGNSVGSMLGSADGRFTLVVAGGEISKLLMEQVGLHLIEILQLKLAGDKTIKLHCAVADFGVKSGVMQANALVLDTEVSTILGSGTVDLGHETLALTLMPKTRFTSPVALRSPIYVGGTFAKPDIDIDKARIAVRGLGALALGLANPLLALIPLVEMGPGVESQCAQQLRAAPAARPAP